VQAADLLPLAAGSAERVVDERFCCHVFSQLLRVETIVTVTLSSSIRPGCG
jgi:hypothetical protein